MSYKPMYDGGVGWAEQLSPEAVAAELEARCRKSGQDFSGVTVMCADSIKPEPIAWLWDGWLARGKVHVIAGAPGAGKTTLALALAATLTVGGRWPDGSRTEPESVLLWSGEDDPKDTLVPRLIACGADLSRVHFVASFTNEDGTRAFDPATDADALSHEAALMDQTPSLLIVDPLVSAVAGDSHKNAEVRRALQPLVDLASVRGCAVLGITHFTKATAARDPVERVTGSLAFGALARVVLGAAKMPQGEGGGRILARAKNNLSIDSGGFGYDLQPCELEEYPGVHTIRVLWGEAIEGTARELLNRAESHNDPEEEGALADAKGFIRAMLAGGPIRAKRIYQEAREAGHSERTLKRAKMALGVEATKDGMKGPWLWSMSSQECQGGQHGPNNKPWPPSEDLAPFSAKSAKNPEECQENVSGPPLAPLAPLETAYHGLTLAEIEAECHPDEWEDVKAIRPQ